jgi:hypothetical protein
MRMIDEAVNEMRAIRLNAPAWLTFLSPSTPSLALLWSRLLVLRPSFDNYPLPFRPHCSSAPSYLVLSRFNMRLSLSPVVILLGSALSLSSVVHGFQSSATFFKIDTPSVSSPWVQGGLNPLVWESSKGKSRVTRTAGARVCLVLGPCGA